MDRNNLPYLNAYPHGWWDVGQDVGVEHLFGAYEADDTSLHRDRRMQPHAIERRIAGQQAKSTISLQQTLLAASRGGGGVFR